MPRHVRLHLRFPAAWSGAGAFVARLRSLFDHYNDLHNLGLSFSTASSEGLQDPRLDSVNPGTCVHGPSNEAVALFRAHIPSGMSDDEIGVLFARELRSDDVKWGCAHCPVGRRGVLVSCAAPAAALAHEIAHLFLGTGHDSSKANLMFRDVAQLTQDPPMLLEGQVLRLRAANWVLPAMPAFDAAVATPEAVLAATAMPAGGTMSVTSRRSPRKTKAVAKRSVSSRRVKPPAKTRALPRRSASTGVRKSGTRARK